MPKSARLLVLCLLALTTRLDGQAPPTFQSGVRLVQVSAVVHDRNGKLVSDLTAADFKLFEDGKEQRIQVFSVEGTAPGAAPPVLPANLFSNRADRQSGGVTVVLFDRLNTEFEHQSQARDQVLKYLSQVQPSDRVALYVLESDVVTILHDFTTDASRLVRALSRYRGSSSGELAGSDATVPDVAKGGGPHDAEMDAWLKLRMEAVANTYIKRRAELTSAALESIANHLAGTAGRKNLIWVSSGFPMVMTEGSRTQALTQEVNRATRAINDASIAVYPVDARGLVSAFASAPGARTPVFSTLATTSPVIDTMRTIADATGGRAFYNSNAIGDAVRRAIDDSRVSYVVGYYPSHGKWDGKSREITLKVNRDGLEVRHRRSYLAFPPQPRQNASGRSQALVDNVRSPLEASGIDLMAQIERPEGQARDEAIMVIRVDAAAVTWEKRAAMWEGALDVLIAQSQPDGQLFKSTDSTINLNATEEQHQRMLKEGFTFTSKVALRDTAYRVHIVVRDVATWTTGSLIIPAERVRAAIR